MDVLCCMIPTSRRPNCATVQVFTHSAGPTAMSVIALEEGDDTLEFENKAPQQQLHVLTIKYKHSLLTTSFSQVNF